MAPGPLGRLTHVLIAGFPAGPWGTNCYVVTDENTGQPMRNISVLFADGELLDATVRGYDIQTDLAVVKVEPKTPLVPAEFGDSDALKVGQVAYAIGSPGGVQLANTMTNGIISAINRDIMVNDRETPAARSSTSTVK